MNFDRNTVLGFVVLALLFFGYFWYTNREQATFRKEQARIDSIANANRPKTDTLAFRKDSIRIDSQNRVSSAGTTFGKSVTGSEQLLTVETPLEKITFTNKGGQPKSIELKKFKQYDSSLVKIASSDFDNIDYPVSTGNRTARIIDLYFITAPRLKMQTAV